MCQRRTGISGSFPGIFGPSCTMLPSGELFVAGGDCGGYWRVLTSR